MSNGKIPRAAYEMPLLQSLLELGGSAAPGDPLYRLIAEKMGFVPDGMEYDLVHAREKWVYTLQWVRYTLVRQGDLDGSQKGVWTLTEQGRQRAETGRTIVRAVSSSRNQAQRDQAQEFLAQFYEARLGCLATLSLSQSLTAIIPALCCIDDLTAEQIVRRALQILLDDSVTTVMQTAFEGAEAGESAECLRLAWAEQTGHRLKPEYEREWRRAINRLTKQFAERFVDAEGIINWSALDRE